MAGEAVKMSSETKGKAVEAALANIEKKFGKGSIMRSCCLRGGLYK
jgi:RecA/RadA recombinase